MLSVCMLEHTLRTKHFLITLTVELDFFVLMNITLLQSALFFARGTQCLRLNHRECSENCIIDRKVLCDKVVSNLVERALNGGMLADLLQAFEAESVSTG